MAHTCVCILSFLAASCCMLLAFFDDIKESLDDVYEASKYNADAVLVLKKFTEFVQFDAEAKQLSKSGIN